MARKKFQRSLFESHWVFIIIDLYEVLIHLLLEGIPSLYAQDNNVEEIDKM